jgi:hypothetical protein
VNQIYKKLIEMQMSEVHSWLLNNERQAEKSLSDKELERLIRTKEQVDERKAEIVKATASGKIYAQQQFNNIDVVDYVLTQKFLIKQNHKIYEEERAERRRATFSGKELIKDEEIVESFTMNDNQKLERYKPSEDTPFYYNRMKAIQYAERWWNTYNPKYKKFENDCTNFISQCLEAGNAPQHGYPNRGKGWWFKGDNWSYSWSVANALRWYLSSAENGLKAIEVSSADQLVPGDVICYDFDGDGKWQHNTIVVTKDENNMPLVNAHTTNSRQRYWEYKDSTAYTPKIEYKFFHIIDEY